MLVARTRGTVAIHDVDRSVPVFNDRMVDQLMRAVSSRRLVTAIVLSVFAAAAVLVAAIGLYGVIGQNVSKRRQKIGVRMALVATSEQVLRLFLGHGLLIVAIGIGCGLLAAVAAAESLATLVSGHPAGSGHSRRGGCAADRRHPVGQLSAGAVCDWSRSGGSAAIGVGAPLLRRIPRCADESSREAGWKGDVGYGGRQRLAASERRAVDHEISDRFRHHSHLYDRAGGDVAGFDDYYRRSRLIDDGIWRGSFACRRRRHRDPGDTRDAQSRESGW